MKRGQMRKMTGRNITVEPDRSYMVGVSLIDRTSDAQERYAMIEVSIDNDEGNATETEGTQDEVAAHAHGKWYKYI